MFLIILKLRKLVSMQLRNYLVYSDILPDQYKTKQMYGKAILENPGTLKCVLGCHKNLEIV